jgi:DamX protein
LAEEDVMQAAAEKAEAESVAAEWAEAEGAAAEAEVDNAMEGVPAGVEAPAMIAGESWILEQNPGHYTIQVMALDSEDSIRVQVEDFEYLAPFAIYTLPDGANTVFVLVQGRYETVEAARAARDAFPSRLERPEKVWIRRFGMIQDRIREARAR